MQCQAHLKSGTRAGQQCPFKARPNGFCGNHKKQAGKAIYPLSEIPFAQQEALFQTTLFVKTHTEKYAQLISELSFQIMDDQSIKESTITNLIEGRNVCLTSYEPQIGKTHAMLSLMWILRHLHKQNIVIILDDSISQQNQLVNRIKDSFNPYIKELLDQIVLPSHFFFDHKEQIYELLKLRSVVVCGRALSTEKLHQDLSYVLISIGNSVKMRLSYKYIKTLLVARHVARPDNIVVFIDEVHSRITSPDLAGAATKVFHDLAKLGILIIGVSATPFALAQHRELGNLFPVWHTVQMSNQFKQKGLIYRNYASCIPIIINHLPLRLNKWTDAEYETFKWVIENFRTDQGYTKQKLLGIFLPDRNEDQARLAEFIEAHYPNIFQIYVFNQKNHNPSDFLDKCDSVRPIIIIARRSAGQGITLKPTLKHRLEECPGMTHKILLLSDDTHGEGAVQFMRGNGIFKADMPRLKLYISEQSKALLDRSIANNYTATRCLENKSLEQTPREALMKGYYTGPKSTKHTRPSAGTIIHKEVSTLNGPFESQVELIENVTFNGIQSEYIERTRIKLNLADPRKVSDLFNQPSEQNKLRQMIVKEIKRIIPDFDGSHIQGSYTTERYQELLKHLVNPKKPWIIQVIVGSPNQTLSNLDVLVYHKYKPTEFEADKFYHFEAPDGLWYVAQHHPCGEILKIEGFE